jgi:hypothetical protein
VLRLVGGGVVVDIDTDIDRDDGGLWVGSEGVRAGKGAFSSYMR